VPMPIDASPSASEAGVIRLARTPSTQDAARALPIGSVVVADHQTAGRGRLGRRWETPPGAALLASFVLPARPLASLAAGVAVAAACADADPGRRSSADIRLKWPNDVLLDGRKLAGILVERVDDARCVVGIGVNLTWAPPGAAALGADREALLAALRGELGRRFAADDAAVLEAWRGLADTLGRRVRVELPNEAFEGIAEALAPDGSLIVGGRTVTAGDVVHLR
jgi:BirA family biotin operon repressor/biotin-[acetyl-CoA-carboxylase] ligase